MSTKEGVGGYGFALLAACLWGLIGPVAKLAFGDGTGPVELAFWRAALAGALFFGYVRWRGLRRLPTKDWPGAVLFGALGVALFYVSYHRAVATGGAALAAVLLYTAPAQIALVSFLFLDERATLRKIVAAVLSVLGVALVAFGSAAGQASSAFSTPGLLWGLLASACYVFYYLFGQRLFQRAAPASVYALAFPVGALCLLPFSSGVAGAQTAASWGAVLWLGVASTFAAYLAHGEALRYLEATRVSVVTSFEPVVASAVAYTWWDERLGTLGWTGGALVVVAAFVAATAPSSASEEVPPPKRSTEPASHGRETPGRTQP